MLAMQMSKILKFLFLFLQIVLNNVNDAICAIHMNSQYVFLLSLHNIMTSISIKFVNYPFCCFQNQQVTKINSQLRELVSALSEFNHFTKNKNDLKVRLILKEECNTIFHMLIRWNYVYSYDYIKFC